LAEYGFFRGGWRVALASADDERSDGVLERRIKRPLDSNAWQMTAVANEVDGQFQAAPGWPLTSTASCLLLELSGPTKGNNC